MPGHSSGPKAVAQGHAVYAGTCGFVVRISKKPHGPRKRRVALRYKTTDS